MYVCLHVGVSPNKVEKCSISVDPFIVLRGAIVFCAFCPLSCVPIYCFCYCRTTKGTVNFIPQFLYVWMFDKKKIYLIRPDILILPLTNEVEHGDGAGRACEDKNNKQQRFWLEGKLSGCVDVGYCEPMLNR